MSEQFLPPQRIGFIGLGNMGAPMAGHLARAGFTMVAADSNPAALERAAARGLEIAASLPELARSVTLVITMLPDGHAVKEVLLGPSGLVPGLAAGSVVIDMSSSRPAGTRALSAELAAVGITLIDAPVSGGVRKAVEGTLAIMAGGETEAIERCMAVLMAMGKVYRTGASGTGHAMKALNNYLSAAALATTAEAVLAGERFGIEPGVMIEILNSSTGRNTATEQKYPAHVLPRTFNSGFALALMTKDLRIALELAREAGTPAELLAGCAQLYEEALGRLGTDADNTDLVRYLESQAAPLPAQP
jgi:3-hydroxyisobutyrate dehydrogenase